MAHHGGVFMFSPLKSGIAVACLLGVAALIAKDQWKRIVADRSMKSVVGQSRSSCEGRLKNSYVGQQMTNDADL